MEYLLSEEEYEDLLEKGPAEIKEIKAMFMKLYFHVTDTECNKGKGYCDGCAFSSGIGFWDKRILDKKLKELGWSYEKWGIIECGESKSFSK